MGEYVKAEPLLQQAFTIRETVEEQRPDYATSLNNLAGLYASMGGLREAEPFYQQALAITRKVLGEQHPDYAQSLDNLAGLYASMNQHGRAASR